MTLSTPLREREVEDQPTTEEALDAALEELKDLKSTRKPDGTPTERGWLKIGLLLRDEMPVKQRPGRGNLKFDYITARQVAERLDSVVGPGNWQTQFLVIDADKAVVQCTLTIFGQGKADVGYPNNPGRPELEEEPYKAAYSDAFKRAAVAWGIGRFLYDDV